MKKGVLRNFAKFTEKHLCQSLFFNKVADLRPATLFKKRFWRRYFPVNFAKFLRTPFLTKHLWWLLLKWWVKCIIHVINLNELLWIVKMKVKVCYSHVFTKSIDASFSANHVSLKNMPFLFPWNISHTALFS